MLLATVFRTILLRSGILAAAMAGALAPVPGAAQGDLLIAPTRLVLDGRRGGEVILSNIGAEEATYRVALELRRMTSEGELERVDDLEANVSEKAALEMIRYAPRRVTLPPNEPQAIRISARPGADLPDGEYRVHMSFSALPKVQPASAVDEAAAAGEFAIRLTPIYGITMPIIIRKGELQVTAALANPRVEQTPEGTAFAVDINRNGTASVYGDLLVYPQGSGEPVFVARGIGVYPEIAVRQSAFGITPEQAALLRGPMRVELRDPVAIGGALIASVDAVIQ
jgi:hypothetical protein